MDEQRERRRLEESLKRAITSLQRSYPETVRAVNATPGWLPAAPGAPG
jgi:hypothetical protein